MKTPESLKARALKMRARWENRAYLAAEVRHHDTWRQSCDWIYALDCLLDDQQTDPAKRIPFDYTPAVARGGCAKGGEMKEICLPEVPSWKQDEKGQWFTIHVGDIYNANEADGRPSLAGIVTRIEPVDAPPDRLLDYPPKYRLFANIYIKLTPTR